MSLGSTQHEPDDSKSARLYNTNVNERPCSQGPLLASGLKYSFGLCNTTLHTHKVTEKELI